MPRRGIARGATVAPPSREKVTAGVPATAAHAGNWAGAAARRRGAASSEAALRSTRRKRAGRFTRSIYAGARSALPDRATAQLQSADFPDDHRDPAAAARAADTPLRHFLP